MFAKMVDEIVQLIKQSRKQQVRRSNDRIFSFQKIHLSIVLGDHSTPAVNDLPLWEYTHIELALCHGAVSPAERSVNDDSLCGWTLPSLLGLDPRFDQYFSNEDHIAYQLPVAVFKEILHACIDQFGLPNVLHREIRRRDTP